MAGIRIQYIDAPVEDIVGSDVGIDVTMNNRNLWTSILLDEEKCWSSGEFGTEEGLVGHKGEVRMEIRDVNGDPISQSEWIQFCAPDDSPDFGQQDPVIPFGPVSFDRPGTYTIHVEARDEIDAGHHFNKSRNITIKSSSQVGEEPVDNGDDSYLPWVPDDGNGGGDDTKSQINLLATAIENPVGAVAVLGVTGYVLRSIFSPE